MEESGQLVDETHEYADAQMHEGYVFCFCW